MNVPRSRWIARIGGVALGVAAFVGVNVRTGRAIVPTLESVNKLKPVPPSPPPPPKPPYQAVCSPCHQPEGQGIPFAFPPLAGSPWMTGDPETPIRIVLLGMTGPIEVNGSTFNLVMPPPPALDDAQIAEAISYARSNFGNSASAVTAEMVKTVRESLGARTASFTATELTALRTGAMAGGDAAKAGAAAATGPAPAQARTPKPRRGRPVVAE